MHSRRFALLSSCLIFVAGNSLVPGALPARAAVSPDVLKAGIKEERLLHGEATVSVNGSDVMIDGYRNPEATDNDCKIDAVLAAKKVFQVDKDATRVTMRFRDPRNPAIYSEAVVTIGDVTAFGAGAISKEQLLSAMTLRRVAPESAIVVTPPSAVVTPPVVAPSDGGAGGAAGTTAPAVTKPPAGTPTRSGSASGHASSGGRFNAYNLSFAYPAGWTPSTPSGGTVQVRMILRGGASKQPSMIDLRVYSSKQAQAATLIALPPKTTFSDLWGAAWMETMPDEVREKMEMMATMKQAYQRAHPEYAARSLRTPWYGVTLAGVTIPAATKMGTQPALQKAFWATAAMSPRQYLRTVVCATPQYVYQFNLAAPAADSGVANAALDEILRNVTFKR